MSPAGAPEERLFVSIVTARGLRRPLVTGGEGILLGVALAVFAVVRNLPGMWVYLGPLLGPPG